MVDDGRRKVFAGGENTLAAYAIDPTTGKPTPIQHVDTHGIHCRTFHIDPSGRLLVAAHIQGITLRDGALRCRVACRCSASATTVGSTSSAKYDIDVSGGRTMWWMGMVSF